MSIQTAEHLDAVRHVPAGATLIIHAFAWDEYERLLEDLADRSHVRVSYDRGKLEVMSPLPEHEAYARFIDDVVRALSDTFGLELEKRGSATWKKRSLARGVEPDACYYVGNAGRIIGRRTIDLESDPPPDIVVEIDVTNESLSKFSIYSALAVPEIWRYDGRVAQFYELAGDAYREVSESRSFPRFTSATLALALEQSQTDGQTAALTAFRQRLGRLER
jgi:Uma2 family endonuclease